MNCNPDFIGILCGMICDAGFMLLPSCTNVWRAFCVHLHKPGCECESRWVKPLVVLLELSRWWPSLSGKPTLEDSWSFQSSSSEKWRTLPSWEPSGLWGFFCRLPNPVSSFYTRTLCQLMSNNVNLPHVDSNQELKTSQRWREKGIKWNGRLQHRSSNVKNLNTFVHTIL